MMTWTSALDFENAAMKILEPHGYDYIAGGAGSEDGGTQSENDLKKIRLVHRILRNVGEVDLSVTLLGKKLLYPFLIAATAYQSKANPQGEVASQSGAELWFQLYMYNDRDLTKALLERAEAAGYEAIVLTVDVPVLGIRYRDRRNHFQVPTKFQLANALPRSDLRNIRDTVGDRLEIMVGGVIRNGSDILKFLCLGADAVLLGRPFMWALSADGADGVVAYANLLKEEMLRALPILGVSTIRELNSTYIQAH